MDSQKHELQELTDDWKMPRTALPNLGYFKPWNIVVTAIFGLMVLAILTAGALQVLFAYMAGEGFDVTQTVFVTTGLLNLVAGLGAAAQLRRLALWMSLRRQTKKTIVIAEYKTELSPVEVGIMVDAYSDKNETSAMLYRLYRNGVVEFGLENGEKFIHYVDAGAPLSPDEKIFLDSLFERGGTVNVTREPFRLSEAAREVRRAAYDRIVANGYLPLMSSGQKIFYFMNQVTIGVGSILSLFLFGALFSPDAYVILYPRYPMELWQVGYDFLFLAILIGVPLQAYLSSVYSKSGLEKYREAAGLYLYMKTVFPGRWKDGSLARSELDYYLPYAQAFGMDDTPKRELSAFL